MIKINNVASRLFNRDTTKLRKVPVYNSKTDFGPKKDIFTRVKDFAVDNPKETAVGAMAVVGGIVGAALLLTKGKPLLINHNANKILSKTGKIQQQVPSITENAQKEYAEVLALLQQDKLNGFADVSNEGGNIVRKFVHSDKYSLMHEISGKKIVRETQFNPDTLDIQKIGKEVKYAGAERRQAKLEYDFENGKLKNFCKGIVGNLYDESESKAKIKQCYMFYDNSSYSYINNILINGKNYSFGENYLFVHDKLKRYEKGLRSGAIESHLRKTFDYSPDGKLIEYEKGRKLVYDPKTREKTETIKEAYALDKLGRLVKQKQ